MVKSLVVAAVATGVSLCGCGQPEPTPAPTPAPVPSNPTSVSQLWEWHSQAFFNEDLRRIMEDYDDDNVIAAYNDGCSPGVLREFRGKNISVFYGSAFRSVEVSEIEYPTFIVEEEDVGNPLLENESVSMKAANLFVVYTALPGLLKSTDSILFKEVDGIVKFKLTNVVVTQPGFCDVPGHTPEMPVLDPNHVVTRNWNQYWDSFQAQNKIGVMRHFTEASVAMTYTMNQGYMQYTGRDMIGKMFDDLWSSMNAQVDGEGSNGFEVADEFPRVQEDTDSVFLVWSSYSNPKVTSTFVFDDDGMVLRMTTVTVAGGTAPAPAPTAVATVV